MHRRGRNTARLPEIRATGHSAQTGMRRAGMSGTPSAALPPWFRPPPPVAAGHALIVGGGIAGAATAAALKRRGWRVTVAEQHDRVAAGASGNPAGIHMPRVVAGQSPERDFHATAWRYGLEQLARLGPAVTG